MPQEPRPSEPIEVQTYSGRNYAERPTSFVWRQRLYRVKEVAAEWQEPRRKHFLVRTEEDEVYEVCYDEQHDGWLLLGRRAMG